MAHLVKPSAYRAGKTYAWQQNILAATPTSTTLAVGLTKISKFMLKRKRLYVVNGTICRFINKKIVYNLLFAPKIKTKRRERRIGAFTRRVTFKPYLWNTQLDLAKTYVKRRQEKIAKISRRSVSRLNRWLSRRMFRGASSINWKRRKLTVPPHRTRLSRLHRLGAVHWGKTFLSPGLPRRNREFDKDIKNSTIRKLHRRYRARIHRLKKWKYDKIKVRRFNDRHFSLRLGTKLRLPVKARALNIFSYLSAKNILTYKTHQRHFWNYKYRRYRFQYKNYYDIVNAFFVLGLLDHSETFLLSVLRITLPQILKIKKFYRFLDTVVKNMPELREKYSIFKISVTGKLAGGTKRTKFHSIGYGLLPVQTLSLGASSKFLAYTHIYGEFGLKLLMCKDHTPKKIEQWK